MRKIVSVPEIYPTGKSHMITDTTYALLDRFKKTPKHVKCFDVLVGIPAPADFINYVNPLNLSKREKQSAKGEV